MKFWPHQVFFDEQSLVLSILLSTYLLPGMQLACRAATTVLYFGLSLDIFFYCSLGVIYIIVFSFPTTVGLYVVFFPLLHIPSWVQCNAVLVREFLSFLITCLIHSNAFSLILYPCCLVYTVLEGLHWIFCLARNGTWFLLSCWYDKLTFVSSTLYLLHLDSISIKVIS